MKVSRDVSIRLQRVLDEWVPPAIRDARWFVWVPMFLFFRSEAGDVTRFKDTAFALDEADFRDVYRRIAGSEVHGDTDLNEACIERILASVSGRSVLEVGTGRGLLAGKLAAGHVVTAVDLVISADLRERLPDVSLQEANIEALPFQDDEFDTVVCTHTLEHVQRLPLAIAELRRVAARRLIIVVPRQRPYRYTFNLHINFFPYAWSLIGQFGYRSGANLKDLGDWYYQEDDPESGG